MSVVRVHRSHIIPFIHLQQRGRIFSGCSEVPSESRCFGAKTETSTEIPVSSLNQQPLNTFIPSNRQQPPVLFADTLGSYSLDAPVSEISDSAPPSDLLDDDNIGDQSSVISSELNDEGMLHLIDNREDDGDDNIKKELVKNKKLPKQQEGQEEHKNEDEDYSNNHDGDSAFSSSPFVWVTFNDFVVSFADENEVSSKTSMCVSNGHG